MADTALLWEQLDGESDLWFKRFLTFRDLGEARTIEETWRLSPTRSSKVSNVKQSNGRQPRPNFRWYNAAKEYAWRERAHAWDLHQRQQKSLAEAKEREKRRDDRRRLALLAKGILAAELTRIRRDVQSGAVALDIDELTRLMKATFNEERIDFDDLPAQKTALIGDSEHPIATENKNLNLNANFTYDVNDAAEILRVLDEAGALEPAATSSNDTETE